MLTLYLTAVLIPSISGILQSFRNLTSPIKESKGNNIHDALFGLQLGLIF
jgi:hypothetical protein